jgi:hypothetical protein
MGDDMGDGMNEAPERVFQIGLTMSGAISAGAYTAGVLDFLIEALEAWEEARKSDPTVPDHRVGVKVISGASAGAITAAIGAISLVDKTAAQEVARNGVTYRFTCPRLYESWVVRPTLDSGDETVRDFLWLDDLDTRPPEEDDLSRTSKAPFPSKNDPVPVVSLLNSRLLDEIALKAITVESGIAPPRPYVSATLHMYLTLSNLRGVPWTLPFDGGDYSMISHGDRAHFVLREVGGWNTSSDFADTDPARDELGMSTIVDPAAQARWRDYAVCALGSSAFPVGLAPRLIHAPLTRDYDGRRYPSSDIAGITTLKPNWPDAVVAEKPYYFTCADGGVIDNDPFEYARYTLKDKATDPRIPFALASVDRAVVMISPFPEPKPIRNQGEPAMDIVSLFSALMPSLIDQARFKPSELALAVDPEHGSRYLIGPVREIGGARQRYGIASGLLGGFGGFVARDFRDHDYQLGRKNCQDFLLNDFALSATNEIVARWPASVDRSLYVASRRPGDPPGVFHRLVPLYGSARRPVELPPWPQITSEDLDRLLARIRRRFDAVAPRLVRQNIRGILAFLLGLVLLPGVRDLPGLVTRKAMEFVRLTILADLVRRNQIKGWELPGDLGVDPDDARLVIAELLEPKYDERSVEGIRKAVGQMSKTLDPDPAPVVAAEGLDAEKAPDKIKKAPDKILVLLEKLKAARGKPYQVWEAPKIGDRRFFTLESRKPGLASRAFAYLGVPFFAPTIDSPGV